MLDNGLTTKGAPKPGSLYAAILAAATPTYKQFVVNAFNNVSGLNGSFTNIGTIYQDPSGHNEALGKNGVPDGSHGKYEIGNVYEPETPVKNVL